MVYPDFFACEKCTGMLVDKGMNAHLEAWVIFEVRY